ncbi:MAG: hypothetical protein IH936_04305 [Acidobacteria bacterium]|nr:hypothetical protein [Acidobacteriota bacterium]
MRGSGRLRHTLRHGALILVAVLLMVPATALAQPTVNGLFYGDGDDALYQPYGTSIGGSVLYSYLDVPSTTLYVALVVNHAVNDLVCQDKDNPNDYMESADAGAPVFWNNHRNCNRASDSEFASFTLECAPMSPNSWSWRQAFGCSQVAGPPESSWVSADTCPSSTGIWPPSIMASTSWVQNVNAYQANLSPAWDMYVDGTALEDWKSPFLLADPDDVTIVPGYPTYSVAHEWEWSMFYEWSVDLGPGGTDCGSEPIFFLAGESHHSPPKSGPENDSFPPPSNPIFSDWGDLPDTYATTEAANGARHYITVDGPYLGVDLQSELDGVPTVDASGDGPEEDGLTINVTDDWDPATTQTISVEVANAPVGAVLAGWFDWNGDGDFGDPGEYFTWAVVAGSNSLDVVVGAAFDWASDSLPVRLRVMSSGAAAPGGSLDSTDFEDIATDGEVEDYIYSPGVLPVTLNAFASEFASGGSLTVRWQTASETDNVGFELLGRVRGEWQPLGEFVPSKGMNSSLPQSYEAEVFLPAGLTALELVNYDTRGLPERFGSFSPGARYGEFQAIQRVDWAKPRAERAARLEKRGFSKTGKAGHAAAADFAKSPRWRKLENSEPGRGARPRARGSRTTTFEPTESEAITLETGPMTHVAVTEAGIQRVSYETLRDSGLDLLGVRSRDIALTWRGEPVARWIDGKGTFGPGSSIEFIGRAPRGDDALYVESNLYQVSIDPVRARPADKMAKGKARKVSDAYLRESTVDRAAMYHPQSPTGDPWVEHTVLVRGASTVTLTIPVDGPVLDGPSRLLVGLGTVTDLPDLTGPGGEAIPEHNVEVWFSGPGSDFVHVTTASTSGQQDWELEAEIPRGVLQAGTNRLQLRFDTDYFYSLVVIDRYGVRYPGPYLGPELDFDSDPSAGGYRVHGFGGPSIAAYGEHDDGSLTRITPWVTPSAGGFAAELRQLDAAHFWLDESPYTPEVFTTDAPADLLAGPAELLVITASSFVGTQALDDYLAEKSAFQPVVIDVEDIYNGVGFGMALPAAITDYLKVRNQVYPFTHVQLVGTDCYDRLNYLSDCISFIPLPTARVGVTIYSPSQNRLVDLDGDGVGDKAVAQFSVRDEAELATIVQKGSDWNTSGLSGEESALLIAEETDRIHSFIAQIKRLKRRLDWSESDVLDMADHPDVNTAREVLRSALDDGRTVTVFSGHSSPSVWAFRSLVTASSVETLTNFGLPTVMVPLACETTYDISPNANVLGHQLLYGGGQGALAISGAVALSNLNDNERMAAFILDGLKSGLTLGEAVQAGRDALGTDYQTLLDNWMTQGDVTTRTTP